MLITTGYNFEGHVITQYIDVISASVVLGTGIFSSFGAAFAVKSASLANATACAVRLSFKPTTDALALICSIVYSLIPLESTLNKLLNESF